MPRKRLEGRFLVKQRNARRAEKRPSRDRPDAAHWQRVAGLSPAPPGGLGKKRSRERRRLKKGEKSGCPPGQEGVSG
ncbi:hypothetical protein D7U25_21195 [Salmonella enterica]|nr:hypothetical protein [Salmonella enterica]